MRHTLESKEKQTNTNSEISSGNMSNQVFFYAKFFKITEKVQFSLKGFYIHFVYNDSNQQSVKCNYFSIHRVFQIARFFQE